MESWLDKAGEKVVPGHVQILLTYRCNLRCSHCYLHGTHERELTANQWRDVLVDLRESGTFIIAYSGGELFLHDEWQRILTETRNARFLVRIITNGTLITKNVASILALLGVSQVGITLFALDAGVHDSITGISGSHRSTMNAIANLEKHGVPIQIKTPIMLSNYSEYSSLHRWTEEQGFDAQIDTTITPRWRDNGHRRPRLSLPIKDQADFYRQYILPRIAENTYSQDCPKEHDRFMCFVGCRSAVISPAGNVHPCAEWPLSCGNVTEAHFLHIWRHSPVFRRIRQIGHDGPPQCRECELRPFCVPCPGIAFQETGDFMSCSPLVRERALVRREATLNS